MNKPVNIYRSIMFDLNPKVKKYIDHLNQEGQIDVDEYGYPYVMSVEQDGSNHIVRIVRNRNVETFAMNPRKKSEPEKTWNPDDGYVRRIEKQRIDMGGPHPNGKKPERPRRVSEDAINQLVDMMLRE